MIYRTCTFTLLCIKPINNVRNLIFSCLFFVFILPWKEFLVCKYIIGCFLFMITFMASLPLLCSEEGRQEMGGRVTCNKARQMELNW